MRALSLHEPWASLMARGMKRIETRGWRTDVRGAVAIHAAKQPFHPGDWPIDLTHWLNRVGFWEAGRCAYGKVVAVGQLVDCVPVEQIRDTISAQERAFGDYSDGRFAWIFDAVQPLDAPVAAKGMQGFWNWNQGGSETEVTNARGDGRIILDEHDDLKLHVNDFAGEMVAILGIKGSGKSYTARLIAEALLDYIPMTIVDIDGEYHTLREVCPELEVYGGDNGQPLGVPSALAERSFRDGVPVVLDFSGADQETMFDFLESYVDRLWKLSSPVKQRRSYGLLIEEAHEFVPQSKTTPIKTAIQRIAARGRKRGFTTIFVSQRSQKVDKDTLTACGLYFLHHVMHPNDLSTYCDLIPRPKERVHALTLALAPGAAIFRRQTTVQVVSMRTARSRHGGATPMILQDGGGKSEQNYDNGDELDPFGALIPSGSDMADPDSGALEATPLAPADGITRKGEIAWIEGVKVAWALMAYLADVCERITVGGSLRRSKPVVGDVEIIAMPGAANVDAFERRCRALLDAGLVTCRLNKLGNRIAWSSRYKAVWFGGMPLDLFIVQPDRQWGATAIIRTGPGAANRCLVTTAGIRNSEGDLGVLPKGMKFEDGTITREGAALDLPEEWDVFEALGLPYVPPRLRTVATYQQAARAWRGRDVHRQMLGDKPEMRDWGWARSPEGRWYRLDGAECRTLDPVINARVEDVITRAEVSLAVRLL